MISASDSLVFARHKEIELTLPLLFSLYITVSTNVEFITNNVSLRKLINKKYRIFGLYWSLFFKRVITCVTLTLYLTVSVNIIELSNGYVLFGTFTTNESREIRQIISKVTFITQFFCLTEIQLYLN